MVETQEQYDKRKKDEKYEIANRGEQQSQTKIGENSQLNQDLYAIVPSDSHYGAYYLITGKEKLNCSCPARVVCKHLKGINGKTTSIRISRPSKS